MLLSIVIVNHDTPQVTGRAIRSIRDSIGDSIEYQIIIVDNSDTDALDPSIPDVFLRVENRGFANACNIGARCSDAKYLLFLNSDIIVSPGSIERCLEYLEQHPEAGVVGTRMLLRDGSTDKGCKRGFPTPFSALCYLSGLERIFPRSKRIGKYHMTYIDNESITPVDSVSGAIMLVPRRVYDEIGGWDERFFMHGEDLDFCYRVKAAGYETVYYGAVSVLHEKGASSGGKNRKRTSDSFYQSMRLFYDKHYVHKYPGWVTWLVYKGIDIKRKRSM